MAIGFMDFNKVYKSNPEVKGTPIKLDSKTTKKYKKRLSGKTISQVDSEYWDYIFELLNTASQYTQQEKNEIVVQISEYYCIQTSYQIRSEMLTALADFLLDECLTNKDVDKVSNTEYPILSFRQIHRRYLREQTLGAEVLQYADNKKNYNFPQKRRTTETSENK
ncbi:hypothetical protein [Clostridium ljungdahlii]|uniref:Uncharacterized protein n=1 Tax=Clostridium ljungdahlii TaxID=1538 RepID=A0A166S187_9CLOT|nr:hypothetical protein [Clostridium ljungdahlii]OAA91468.1 hypothetical protein WY13_00725 [Clostridium ljungdahlii]